MPLKATYFLTYLSWWQSCHKEQQSTYFKVHLWSSSPICTQRYGPVSSLSWDWSNSPKYRTSSYSNQVYWGSSNQDSNDWSNTNSNIMLHFLSIIPIWWHSTWKCNNLQKYSRCTSISNHQSSRNCFCCQQSKPIHT